MSVADIRVVLRNLIIALIVAALPGMASAQTTTLSQLEQRRALLDGHRIRLESMLGEQGKRIGRLKAQPAGVARDYQLGAALRENQALATRLTQLGEQLRVVGQDLAKAYTQAITASKDPAERSRLEERRAKLAAAGGSTRIVTNAKARSTDTAEDLDEKADLLQDSEEKVRRQLKQVQTKVAQLEHREKLQRHSKSMDDNPFVEDSPRRSGTAKKVALEPVPAGGGTHGAMTPAPSAKYGTSGECSGGACGTPSASADTSLNSSTGSWSGGRTDDAVPMGRSGTELIVSIRDVMDPSLLTDLKQGKGESATSRLAALKKASERLRQVAGKLSSQAQELRQRAKQLRGKPRPR
jgi:hypothetical protein